MNRTGKKHWRNRFIRVLAVVMTAAMILSLPAMAYDRQEATVATGGTEVSVYAGTQNSNDQGNYLADPGDYLQMSRFWTAGRLESTSNITSSTNFVKETGLGGYTVRGGVEGTSWNAATGTLTLSNASGTVITIEGPSITVSALNTYNSNLSPVIDYNMPNLTYYKQFDMFQMPGQEGGAPHTKDNSTVQDTITINLVGDNSFNNIRLTGNVKVVFTGSGTLTLDAAGAWDYDDYSEPDFDVLSDPAPYAVSSYPTIGHKGSLTGEDKLESTMPNGMVRTITENYEYALPEIALNGVEITEGGEIFNTAQVRGEDYFTFSGETGPTDESRRAEMVTQDLTNSYDLHYNGGTYTLVYSDAKNVFFVTVTKGMGRNATTEYYDVTDGITAWEPWESYIGAEGTPAQKVVLTGTAAAGPVDAQVSPQDLYVNGVYTICEKYNINDQNYFKLRDVAYMLSGTAYQFDLDYDPDAAVITITTDKAYTPTGGEMAVGEDRSDSCVASDWKLTVNGAPVSATVYNLGGNNYFRLRDLGDALGFGVEYDEADNFAVITALEGVLYQHVHDNATRITDSFFDSYFKEGNAKEGVLALLNSGNYYINNVKVPATEDETTTYNVNLVPALFKGDAGWGVSVHKTTTDTNMSFEDARMTLVETVSTVRGHTTTLYTDESGYVTRINSTNVESVLVCGINHWNEDTVFERGDFALETNRGVRPDINNLHFNTKNVDSAIEIGDFAEYWYDGSDNGWHIRRALAVNGTVEKVSGKFVINGADDRIESNVSRYCLRTYNRPTQFYDAYTALGLNDLEITVWCTSTGHPIGFTSGTRANGKAVLAKAIENAKAAADGVVISEDGKDVAAGTRWVAQADKDAFDTAIAAAEKVYNTNSSSVMDYDQALYELARALGQGGNNPSGFLGSLGEGSGAQSGGETGGETGAQTKGLQQSGMDGNSYVWVNDGTTPVTDASFDQYFEGTAKEGVEAILNAGAFYVNGLAVPATEDETTSYNVNAFRALYKGDNGWGYSVHKTDTDTNLSFDAARLGFVETLTVVRGHTTTLHLDENGLCDRIDATNVESVYVTDIINHGAQAEIKRGDFALETNRGARPDVETVSFSNTNGCWDDSIEVGDFAIYWYGENGWTIRRAIPVTGTVTKNDAGEFVINGDDNRIESNVSRYCLRTYNRPTQFYNDAYTRLGLNELEVTVWCTFTGHPIGFSCTRAQGKAALQLAVANCRAAMEGVVVSADGKDVAEGVHWVTQEAMDAFAAAVDAAETVANRNATPLEQYDQALYTLGQAYGQGGNRPSGFLGEMG